MTARWITLALCVLAVAPAHGDDATEANKALVRQFVDFGNSRSFDRLGEVVAQKFVRHCQATPGLEVSSLDQLREYLVQDAAAFPDSSVEVHQMIAEGDRVAIWATYHGTQKGPMGPFPASGKKMAVDIGAMFRIENGKIAELWLTWDNLTALSQLGILPPLHGKSE